MAINISLLMDLACVISASVAVGWVLGMSPSLHPQTWQSLDAHYPHARATRKLALTAGIGVLLLMIVLMVTRSN